MSMTKRLIDSLSQEEQDVILGKHDPDEWMDGPMTACSRCGDASIEIALSDGLCDYCKMRRDRRAKCDAHYRPL